MGVGSIIKGMARPTKYEGEKTDKQAYQLGKIGATDKEIGLVLGVCEDTVNEWKKKHPTFSESLKKGKYDNDSRKVKRLGDRAEGYRTKEKKTVKRMNEAGELVVVEEIETSKEVPPDTTALIYWLNNRRPGEFTNRHQIKHTTEDENGNEVGILGRLGKAYDEAGKDSDL